MAADELTDLLAYSRKMATSVLAMITLTTKGSCEYDFLATSSRQRGGYGEMAITVPTSDISRQSPRYLQ